MVDDVRTGPFGTVESLKLFSPSREVNSAAAPEISGSFKLPKPGGSEGDARVWRGGEAPTSMNMDGEEEVRPNPINSATLEP